MNGYHDTSNLFVFELCVSLRKYYCLLFGRRRIGMIIIIEILCFV